jgi:Rps23 Pro-64 3,4-dihydroxylase Tpa1-like proline 4-hydroxylase
MLAWLMVPWVCACSVRHSDNANKNGRRLTAILYLNPEWVPSDGGCLRVFDADAVTVRRCGCCEHPPSRAFVSVSVACARKRSRVAA